LFLLTVLSRIPFHSQILYHWDSVNLAFGMREFDMAAEQPQPPGYIVYVWLARLVDTLFNDPQTTMVWIAVVSSGLGVVAMYLLGRAMFNRRVGLVGALLLASSPLFWFYGEIALPHALDLFLVTLSAWLLYEAAQGKGPYLLAAAVSLSIASGVRQWTPVFLGLILLVAVTRYFRQAGWTTGLRWALPSVVVGGLLCAIWFFPLIASTGGIDRYVQVTSDYSARFNATSSLLMGAGTFGLTRNLRKLGMYTLYGWSLAIVPCGLWLLARITARHGPELNAGRWRLDWDRAVFIAAWILPALAFYAIIHMGQQGVIFVFLPALLLISAAGSVELLTRRNSRWLVAAIAALVIVNAGIFVLAPEYPLGGDRFRILTRQTLRHNDAYFQRRIEAVRRDFSPESTAIIAANWPHVAFYLPDYPLVHFSLVSKWELGEGDSRVYADEQGRFTATALGLDAQGGVLLFDPELDNFNHAGDQTQTLSLDGDVQMQYLPLGQDPYLQISEAGFDLLGDE
jgi:4-amino-4-deoxy-L-arabinose transferase-like glycosyltransferase